MFDPSSGVSYREWIVPGRVQSSPSDRDWSRRCPYPVFTARGTRGPRSLVDIATNVIANNIGDVTDEHLEALPTRLLWHVWRFLEARGVCLHAWRLFSMLLLREEEDDKPLGLYRFRQHICRPNEQLKQYLEPLTSLSTDFVTHLVISGGCDFTTNELLCLAEMRNLGVLELIQPADELRTTYPEVGDLLIRGWSGMDDPFPLLRILRIWGDETTTQDSLQWVAGFPSLVLYDVTGARTDWTDPDVRAIQAGWELATSTSGSDDSLLRYLMLFAPLNDDHNTLRELSRTVDGDLVSLCADSQCIVKFVNDRQAPPLLDYLTDRAKIGLPSWDTDAASRDARACHGAPFEAWAFWLYSFIGQISQDRDLESNGIGVDSQAVVGPFVLPSKPMACLFLGHSGRGGISSHPSYVSRGLFATRRFTFTRPAAGRRRAAASQKITAVASPPVVTHENAAPVSTFRSNKRKRIKDVLEALSR
ncbi:hypothetical protein S7711_02179 [Stachybotrys chartarum IBT 7711]|uniref:Uncharacterized protein n=1 Tax=Stachybotrys chartarum (strain CBS 109288 / IBT 7711) TaxID=1280523 RepID=A0A084ARP5_STACB|nr:hypothetical protein S7711_02179 [Stachybotrys chartarum IBT 7711]KFA48023.1 hypothetical protein S40293_02701 [Stachybotrys chartarum IBT 40293]